MNGANIPHVDVSKIIRDRPALRCHTISAVFVAARTESGDAQRTLTVSEGVVVKNYELRAVQNQTRCSRCTTSARCPNCQQGRSKEVKLYATGF